MTLRTRRVFLAILPAALILTLLGGVIWGDNGIVASVQLRSEVEARQSELAELERSNERMLRELHSMNTDPVVLERVVADELQWSHADAVIVRFD